MGTVAPKLARGRRAHGGALRGDTGSNVVRHAGDKRARRGSSFGSRTNPIGGRGLAALALAAGALALTAAQAQATTVPSLERDGRALALTALPSASVKGAKGWKIEVFAAFSDRVVLSAAKGKPGRGGKLQTTYSAPGKATAKRLKANLGKLGTIDLRFKARKTKRQRPRGCTGTPNKVTRGVWRGRLRFKGEHGYTKVNLTKLRGTVLKPGNLRCDDDGGGPVGPARASLVVTRGNIDRGTMLTVSKADRPNASPQFYVTHSEKAGKVSINRTASYNGRPAEFTYTTPAPSGEADVRPKGPFSGVGRYRGLDSWGGNLRVKLAGAKGRVPLTGAGFHASLDLLE